MRDDVPALLQRTLHVGGVVPFTTTDFPGRLAAVVFMQGCPWRCAYCHNPHLVPAVSDTGGPECEWPSVIRWLETRCGLLDGVVFSGGEPTAQRALGDAIRDVRALGFQVALHTAGVYPRRLAALLPEIDWIGFDVKAPLAAYEFVTGVAKSGAAAFDSLDALRASGVAFEVRTTVHPVLTPPAALQIIARELAARGIAKWVLQPFRPTGCADQATIDAAPRGTTIDAALVETLRAYGLDIVVRC